MPKDKSVENVVWDDDLWINVDDPPESAVPRTRSDLTPSLPVAPSSDRQPTPSTVAVVPSQTPGAPLTAQPISSLPPAATAPALSAPESKSIQAAPPEAPTTHLSPERSAQIRQPTGTTLPVALTAAQASRPSPVRFSPPPPHVSLEKTFPTVLHASPPAEKIQSSNPPVQDPAPRSESQPPPLPKAQPPALPATLPQPPPLPQATKPPQPTAPSSPTVSPPQATTKPVARRPPTGISAIFKREELPPPALSGPEAPTSPAPAASATHPLPSKLGPAFQQPPDDEEKTSS